MKKFKPSGTCASEIQIEVDENNKISKVEFIGGCNGNLAGISALVEGAKVDEIADRLEGIQCRNGTSCPDQLSRALKDLIKNNEDTLTS